MGVLSKVEYSKWAFPVFYVKKKTKKICVGADFSTGFNDVLKSYHYPLPSLDEIFSKLSSGKIFFKFNLSNIYLQIPVNEKCLELLKINTHKGMYKFERLTIGIKLTPAIFQQIKDTMLNELDFAVAYLDDSLINSDNIEQHKKHVHEVFRRIKDYRFKLKDEKCNFFLWVLRCGFCEYS